MRSTFFGLNTALQALVAQRKAMEVSAHNVANANTEGYTRQDAVLAATMPYTTPAANRSAEAGQIGTGVQVDSIRRIRDSFLDVQIRSQLGALGSWETTRGYLSQLESVFNEPSESGLSTLMGKMWGAWQDLSANPESYAAKAAVVQNASVLADIIRRDATQLSDMRQQASDETALKVGELNGYLEKIADLNRQIQQIETVGDEANDLKDQRDLLVDSLARIVPLEMDPAPDVAGSGRATLKITLDGRTLIDGSAFNELRVDQDATTGLLSIKWDDGNGDPSDDPTVNAGQGELGAVLAVYNEVLNPSSGPSATSSGSLAWRLNQMASTLITEVNSLHDYDPVNNPRPFFSGADASDIAVDSSLIGDPSKVRAGKPTNPGDPVEVGDGSLALLIARLQSKQMDYTGDGVADATTGEWYQGLISQLGIDSQRAQGMSANQKLLVDHLETNREAMAGVSLDEEAANMVRFERAYQAAARVMTAMDEMLETLINGVGVVGR